MKNSPKGFTLIEMLVCLALIGILSSVVLASLETAKANSKKLHEGDSPVEIKSLN